MHELGILYHIVGSVEKVAEQNNVSTISKLVLQIGELSSVVPMYIRRCYPVATDGTLLQDAELEIEILPANALCRKCGRVYNRVEHSLTCPYCGSGERDDLGGTEFMIKEIVAC